MNDIFVHEIPLYLREEKERLISFLADFDLQYENDIECAYGLFDERGQVCGCGCASGRLLKCFALKSELRGRNGLGTLISRLMANRFAKGFTDLFVVTRPSNVPLFSNCGFYLLAETPQVALLESSAGGSERYLSGLRKPEKKLHQIGSIVMNGNPPTKGHLALIRHAAAQSDFLYLFVVEEDRSLFPFADRLSLLRSIASAFPNVYVCPGGPYMISAMTFPTYFMKDTESPSQLQSELDVLLFSTRLAPALGITHRFAGEEPFDAVTAVYNNTMRRILPKHGIEFCEVPRACQNEVPISATQVRRHLAELIKNPEESASRMNHLRALLPPQTLDYIVTNLSKFRQI